MAHKLNSRLKLTERNVLLLLLLFTIGFVGYIATAWSNVVLGVFLLPWAAGMTYALLRKRQFRFSPALAAAAAMMAIYIATGVYSCNLSWTWVSGVWILGMCATFVLLIPPETSLEQRRRELFSMAALFTICYLPFALMALYSIFSGNVVRFPGVERPIGLQQTGDVAGRSFVFGNPNTVGRFTVFSILFAIYGIAVRREKVWKAFFAAVIAVNLLLLAHSQSRTCYLALCIALGGTAFRGTWVRVKPTKFRPWLSLLAGAMAAVVVLAGINLLFKAEIRVACHTCRVKAEAEVQVTTRAETEGAFDVYSSGRGEIWPNAMRYLKNHPSYLLTGMGPGDLVERIGEEYPEILGSLNLHNTYLASLAHCGVFHLLAVLAFLIALIRPVRTMLTAPASPERRGMFVVPIFVVMMVAMSIPEEMLFVTPGMSNFLFFFMCGHLFADGRLPGSKPDRTIGTEH